MDDKPKVSIDDIILWNMQQLARKVFIVLSFPSYHLLCYALSIHSIIFFLGYPLFSSFYHFLFLSFVILLLLGDTYEIYVSPLDFVKIFLYYYYLLGDT